MNLTCDKFEPIQTPTWITYLLLSDGLGDMQGVLIRYIYWLKFLRSEQYNRAVGDKEEQDYQWEFYSELIETAEKYLGQEIDFSYI